MPHWSWLRRENCQNVMRNWWSRVKFIWILLVWHIPALSHSSLQHLKYLMDAQCTSPLHLCAASPCAEKLKMCFRAKTLYIQTQTAVHMTLWCGRIHTASLQQVKWFCLFCSSVYSWWRVLPPSEKLSHVSCSSGGASDVTEVIS